MNTSGSAGIGKVKIGGLKPGPAKPKKKGKKETKKGK